MHTLKLIILDRDGVINVESPDFVKSPDEWIPIPGSLEAIGQLNRAGFTVTVATNQSGVGRGIYSLDTLNSIHEKMQNSLKALDAHVDGIFICPHAPWEGCDCRKPKTGLFEQISRQFNVDLKEQHVPCVGDSLRDLEPPQVMGACPILVLTGNGKETAANLPLPLQHIQQFDSLASCVSALVNPL